MMRLDCSARGLFNPGGYTPFSFPFPFRLLVFAVNLKILEVPFVLTLEAHSMVTPAPRPHVSSELSRLSWRLQSPT